MTSAPTAEVPAQGKSFRLIALSLAVITFISVVGIGGYVRVHHIKHIGIECCDSADIWLRTKARIDGQTLKTDRFQPIPDYLYTLSMLTFGRRDWVTPLVNVAFDTANIALMFFLVRMVTGETLAGLAGMALYASLRGAILLAREGMAHPVAVFFIILTLMAFLTWHRRFASDSRSHYGWLALSGTLAAASFCTHMSTQFLCPAYVLLILVGVAATGGSLANRAARFFGLAALFTLSFFLVVSAFIATEKLSSPNFHVRDILQTLAELRDDTRGQILGHGSPIVAATKVRPTVSSATLDHLTLGTQILTHGTLGRGNLEEYWIGDNVYAVSFILSIPIMVFMAARGVGTAALFPGYAIYTLVGFFILGMNATYTIFLAHHWRYLLHVMPFLILGFLFWLPALLSRVAGRKSSRVAIVILAALGLAAQLAYNVSPEEYDTVRPARSIRMALEGNMAPNEKLMIMHPGFPITTGGFGWTLQWVYLDQSRVYQPKPWKSAAQLIGDLEAQNVRFLLTGQGGLTHAVMSAPFRDGHEVKAFSDYLSAREMTEVCNPCDEQVPAILYRLEGARAEDPQNQTRIDPKRLSDPKQWLPWPRDTAYSLRDIPCPESLGADGCSAYEVMLGPGGISFFDPMPGHPGDKVTVETWIFASEEEVKDTNLELQLGFSEDDLAGRTRLFVSTISHEARYLRLDAASEQEAKSGMFSFINRSDRPLRFGILAPEYTRK